MMINGVEVAEFVGIDDFAFNTQTTPNETDGRVRVGVNRTAGANGVDFSVRVRQTSPDLGRLYALALQQTGVPVKWEIARNTDKYPKGYITVLGCAKGYLNPPSISHGGAEAGDVVFAVIGMQPVVKTKETEIGTAQATPTSVAGTYSGAF